MHFGYKASHLTQPEHIARCFVHRQDLRTDASEVTACAQQLARRPCCHSPLRTKCWPQAHKPRHPAPPANEVTGDHRLLCLVHQEHMHSDVKLSDASASSHVGSKLPLLHQDWRAPCCKSANNKPHTVDDWNKTKKIKKHVTAVSMPMRPKCN